LEVELIAARNWSAGAAMFKISIVGPRMCVSSESAKNAQHVITMAWE
jgi:hypothetical protein